MQDIKNDYVMIKSFNNEKTYTRQNAIKLYLTYMECCEGAEKEHYTNIFLKLINGEKIIND